MRGDVPLADIGVELIGVVGNRVARMLRDPAGLEEVESKLAPKARPNINTTFSYGCSKSADVFHGIFTLRHTLGFYRRVFDGFVDRGTPAAVAELQSGLEIFLEFAEEMGVPARYRRNWRASERACRKFETTNRNGMSRDEARGP
jgi:hypothetical protein